MKKKQYLLRCGAVVVVDTSVWNTAGVRVVKAGGEWKVGQTECLLYGDGVNYHDPLTWTGGSHGYEYGIVGEYTGDPIQPQTKLNLFQRILAFFHR